MESTGAYHFPILTFLKEQKVCVANAHLIIVRKERLILGDLPKLAVQAFNGIRRVYDFLDLRMGMRRMQKKSSQLFTLRG